MEANFKMKPLNHTKFLGYFELTNPELEKIGAIRMTVDKFPGFPCRISLEDAQIGEEVILLPYHIIKQPHLIKQADPFLYEKKPLHLHSKSTKFHSCLIIDYFLYVVTMKTA